MCEISGGKTFARDENTPGFKLGFKRKWFWMFSRNLAFTKVFIFAKIFTKTSKSFRESHVTLSVYAKNFVKLSQVCAKTANFFILPRAFAPVLRIFSLKLSGKHILMWKFSGKTNILDIFASNFTKKRKWFSRICVKTRKQIFFSFHPYFELKKVYSVTGIETQFCCVCVL